MEVREFSSQEAELEALLLENADRNKTNEQKVREGIAWEQIEKVKAYKITKPRLIGDIGLRSFFQLRKRALQLVKEESIDFVYIPIPSFYVSLIGNYLHKRTGVKYGIDYIDPWVHTFPGSDKIFSRHWWSTRVARWLEPKAVKKASLITGVAEGYYKGVRERNPLLEKSCLFGAMPYGGEIADHEKLKQLDLQPYLFAKNGKLQFVYAGAMLPKAYGPLEAIFQSIDKNKMEFLNTEFHFIGTGIPNDERVYNIKPLAEKYGLWQTIVFEYPKRIPYLDVLIHLENADAIFILGSTEIHYTPSKTYQAVLSKKPVMAILHERSSAVAIITNSDAGKVLTFNGEEGIPDIRNRVALFFESFLIFKKSFNSDNVDQSVFKQFSATAVTEKLSILLNQVVS